MSIGLGIGAYKKGGKEFVQTYKLIKEKVLALGGYGSLQVNLGGLTL